MDCRRCGRVTYRESAKLVNCYAVYLCHDCLNAWHEFVTPLNAFKDYEEFTMKLCLLRGTAYDESTPQELAVKFRRIENVLYKIAKDWVLKGPNS